ncbi:MAG TPA: hypothetical protein VHE80_09565, partial [Acidimicrobiales bacterium]|nr:hypothetical protein [Acidimicrobiales bacterium]
MTRRLGRRSGAAVALLTVLLATVPASPAAADALITIDSPRAQPALTSSAVTVSGSARSDAPLLYQVGKVRLAIGGNTRDVQCTQQPCRFSWTVTLPSNGPYELNVTATEVTLIGLTGPESSASRSFSVAAPPARPVMDKPTVTEARHVNVSWSRNTEPDMLYYALFRRIPGSSTFTKVGPDIPQPKSGTKVSFTDTDTSAYNGGDFAYQVVAVRKDAMSEPSAVGVASVPAPPTTTSSSTPGPPGAPGAPTTAGPTTTVKAGSAAGVDLSGFLAGRPPAVPVAPITIPEPPDTGFGSTLPFGARPPGEELEEGEAEAVPPRGRTSVIGRLDSGRPLVPVA